MTRLIPITLAAVLAAGCAAAQTPVEGGPQDAVATAALRTAAGADAGLVTMYRGPLGLLFRVEGRDWPAGWHGVHLHEIGTCEGPGFTSAGSHVDHPTTGRAHGLLNMDGGPELGDLQNVWAHADGTARAEVYMSGAGIAAPGQDLMDADGLAFLVHARADDHRSQPIGGSGDRIACGVFEQVGAD